MSDELKLGIVQCALAGDRAPDLDRVERLVREAAAAGAEIILTPELLEGPYFCREEKARFFALAAPLDGHPTIARFSALANELGVVLPLSLFERAGQAYYNSLVVLDADGANLGVYRKSHIPDGPGYEEKFYFRPGDTGFRVFDTKKGRLGVGICWDQWYPEAARAMALLGAEVLLYPTAIGSEPEEHEEDTAAPWRRVMVGHAVANAMPVAAANRVGVEADQQFYGTSFIADQRGEIAAEVARDEQGIAVARFSRAALATYRANWGFFRDRRPDLYGVLLTADGGRAVGGD